MRRSHAPSSLFRSCGASPSLIVGNKNGEKTNHLELYKIPESTKENTAFNGSNLSKRLRNFKRKKEVSSKSKNIYIEEGDNTKIFFICHYFDVDGKSNKCGDGLLEVSFSNILLFDMNSKAVAKAQIIRSEIRNEEGENVREQRIALKTRKKREIYLSAGEEVLISHFLVEIVARVQEEQVLDGSIFFHQNSAELFVNVEKKLYKSMELIVPGVRLRRPGHFHIPWKSDRPGQFFFFWMHQDPVLFLT